MPGPCVSILKTGFIKWGLSIGTEQLQYNLAVGIGMGLILTLTRTRRDLQRWSKVGASGWEIINRICEG